MGIPFVLIVEYLGLLVFGLLILVGIIDATAKIRQATETLTDVLAELKRQNRYLGTSMSNYDSKAGSRAVEN